MIHHYRAMVDDPLRLEAFERSIQQAVKPGDVVADVGSGLGTFAVFACRAGAARVYAVEDSPILDVAKEVVKANGCADRVRFLAGSSTELEVPERAQVVIFEDYVSGLLEPRLVRIVRDLAARWLAPGGTLLPGRARQWVAPVEDADAHHGLDRFAFTGERMLGVNLEPTRRRAFSTPVLRKLGRASLLAAPSLAREVDLSQVEDALVNVRATASAGRAGAIHGLLLWFDLELPPDWLGTGPGASPSAWAQMLFPLDPPFPVEAGASISFTLQASPFADTQVWRWSAEAGGSRREANSLDGVPLSPGALQLSRSDYVAEPRAELEIDRVVLAGVDGRQTVGQLAETLAIRFPTRFPTVAEAQRRVAALLVRYVR